MAATRTKAPATATAWWDVYLAAVGWPADQGIVAATEELLAARCPGWTVDDLKRAIIEYSEQAPAGQRPPAVSLASKVRRYMLSDGRRQSTTPAVQVYEQRPADPAPVGEVAQFSLGLRCWLAEQTGRPADPGFVQVPRDQATEPGDEYWSATRKRWEPIGDRPYAFAVRRRRVVSSTDGGTHEHRD
jgi:hypothetical protein